MRASTVSAVLLVFGVGLAASAPADISRRSPKAKSFTEAISEANKGLNLYSGDIAGVDPDSRNAVSNDGHLWPNGVIPYVISDAFSATCADKEGMCADWAAWGECDANPAYMGSECAESCGLCGRSESDLDLDPKAIVTAPAASELGWIQRSLRHFNRQTCLQFKPRDNEASYVSIVKLEGCWSKPGRMGGMQELSLGDGCMWKGTVRHELMHTVGFWHEHQRPDRDDYVTIMLNNVDPAFHPQFEKISGSSTLDLPYDYGSIMHYGSHLNSINGRETIVPKLPLNGVVLGAAYRLSSLDVQKINKLYGCNK
ncbi:hypothetical protein Bbelb_362940 [Branchiostoma belcheri]|nr:hypothetical protein Bbelb_362940 [Branchiostoma belcheri]